MTFHTREIASHQKLFQYLNTSVKYTRSSDVLRIRILYSLKQPDTVSHEIDFVWTVFAIIDDVVIEMKNVTVIWQTTM